MTGSDPAAGAVDAWVVEHWDPAITVREWWHRLVDAGYAQPTWPDGLGGFGASKPEARAVALALAGHGVVAPAQGHLAATLAAPTILRHGTRQQIQQYLRDIALGERAWCQLFSEPGSGSDLASLATRAVPDGDEWVVTGQKVWNSGADQADLGMLLARTDPDAPRHRGISYFVLEMDQPGVEVRPLRTMNGSTPFCEVFLTEARVGAGALLGGLGEGWRVAQTTMAAERSSVGQGGIVGWHHARSGARGDLDASVGEVVERSRRSARRRSPIRSGAVPVAVMIDLARQATASSSPEVRQRVAEYAAGVRIAGWTAKRSAAARGSLTGADGPLAKLATASTCQHSCDLSYAIVGAAGMLAGPSSPLGGDLQSVNLASPGTRIGGGTDEIQRNVIAERALGLPREPVADR